MQTESAILKIVDSFCLLDVVQFFTLKFATIFCRPRVMLIWIELTYSIEKLRTDLFRLSILF